MGLSHSSLNFFIYSWLHDFSNELNPLIFPVLIFLTVSIFLFCQTSLNSNYFTGFPNLDNSSFSISEFCYILAKRVHDCIFLQLN